MCTAEHSTADRQHCRKNKKKQKKKQQEEKKEQQPPKTDRARGYELRRWQTPLTMLLLRRRPRPRPGDCNRSTMKNVGECRNETGIHTHARTSARRVEWHGGWTLEDNDAASVAKRISRFGTFSSKSPSSYAMLNMPFPCAKAIVPSKNSPATAPTHTHTRARPYIHAHACEVTWGRGHAIENPALSMQQQQQQVQTHPLLGSLPECASPP